MSEIKTIISFILNPTFAGWFLVLKIIFMIVGLIFFGFIIFALIHTSWLKRVIIWDLQEFFSFRPFGVKKVGKDWEEIKAKLKAELESEWKLAVIEADKMLDDTLNRMGFGGVSLGERLEKLTTATLSNIEEVRIAHKIRNNIVHDPTYRLSLEETKKTILIYEKALTDLQAL